MSELAIGDYVLFKLSPSGVKGTALLVEDGHSEKTGEAMFVGHSETRKGNVDVVCLYERDILDVLVTGPAECWGCGREWIATKPSKTTALECPSCGEMMGAHKEDSDD